MTEETHLTETINELLVELLGDSMTQHVPDDERHDHETPRLQRPVGSIPTSIVEGEQNLTPVQAARSYRPKQGRYQ